MNKSKNNIFRFVHILLDYDNTTGLSEAPAFRACTSLVNEVLTDYGVPLQFTPAELLAKFVGKSFRQMILDLSAEHSFTVEPGDLEKLVVEEEDRAAHGRLAHRAALGPERAELERRLEHLLVAQRRRDHRGHLVDGAGMLTRRQVVEYYCERSGLRQEIGGGEVGRDQEAVLNKREALAEIGHEVARKVPIQDLAPKLYIINTAAVAAVEKAGGSVKLINPPKAEEAAA